MRFTVRKLMIAVAIVAAVLMGGMALLRGEGVRGSASRPSQCVWAGSELLQRPGGAIHIGPPRGRAPGGACPADLWFWRPS